jgi:hypothetical protein
MARGFVCIRHVVRIFMRANLWKRRPPDESGFLKANWSYFTESLI